MEEEDINVNSSPGPVQKKTFRSLTSQPKQRPFREYTQASNNRSFYNTGYGESKYDKGFNFDADFNENDPLGSINENRAQQQSGLTQLGTLPLRAINKAATEVAKLAPIVYGVGKAIFEDNETSALEDIFNNEGVKVLDEMSQNFNTDYLPVYVKDSVKNGTLMDNLLSTSFYATEGADGLGFMASMFAPGMILSKFSLGSKLIGGLSKVSKLTKMVEGTEGSVQVLKGLGWSGRAIDSKIAVLTNSMIEAGAESKGTQDALNNERLNEIELYKSKGLSQEQAEEIFNQKHPDWDNQVASAMKGDFWMQMPMLLGTGSMMHKAIFGKALDKVEKTVEYGLKGRVGSMAKQWGKATLSEGFIEEAGQSTLENYYTKKAYEGKLGKGLIGDVNIGDLTKEYINTVSSVEGQKAIFLGALMGGPFMSMEARKEHLKGLKDTNSITNGVKSSIDDYNIIKENDIYEKDPKDPTKPLFKRDENGNITNEKVVNREKALEVAKSLKNIEDDDVLYNEAIKSDDIELQKFIQNRNILKLIAPAIQNGKLGLQILKEELEQTLKFTDISEADKNSKDENNTNKKLVETILAKAEHLQKQNEKFKDFSPDIIKLDDPRTTKELNEEYLNHLNSKYIEIKSLQYDAENNLKELNKKRNNILEELGLDKDLQIEDEVTIKKEESSSLLKQVSDKIRKTEKEVSKYKKDVNELWENKDLINKSFKSYINEKEKKQKQTSEENVQKADEVSKLINKASSTKDLEDIKTDNPIQQKEIEVKKQEFADAEEAVLTEELDNKKAKESLIKNQDLDSLKEMEDTAIDPITGKEGIVMENNENSVVIQTEEGQIIEIKKPKINTENISSNEEVESVKEENEDLYSKSNFSLPSKFNDTFKSFVDFMMKPFNKKGLKTSFKLNTENIGVNLQNAIQIYNEAVNGKSLSLEDKNLLFNWLPLTIEIDGNNSWSGYPGGKGDYSNPEEKFTIRKNIVDAISQGISLENINGIVAGQSSPELNCEFKDNKPVKNNVLEIDYIKELTNNNKDLSKLEIYHVNLEGKLIPVSEGANLNPSAKTKELLSTGVGNIYITIKNPLGNDVPLKLNFSRLGEQLTVSLLDIYKHILTHANEELLYTQSLSDLNNEDSQFYNPILYENLKTKLKGAINLLGNKENEITLEQIIETIILEDSGSNSHLKIVEDEQGQYALEFKEGNRYYLQDLNDSETLSVLTKDIAENKYRNIITIPNEINKTKLSFKNEEYLKYLFNTKALTTNVSTTSYSFKLEEATIWLEPGVTTTKQTKSKPEQVNAFGTNPNFKLTKTVVDPDTGENYEVTESLEDLQKQLETEIFNRDKAPIAKLKDVFEVRIKEIEEKIRNIQKNSVSLSKDLTMEIEKEGTRENKEVVKAKVENILSKAEQIKEIEQMTQLNNMLLLNPSLPQQIKNKFEELKNKYSDEFNKLPKKCNS